MNGINQLHQCLNEAVLSPEHMRQCLETFLVVTLLGNANSEQVEVRATAHAQDTHNKRHPPELLMAPELKVYLDLSANRKYRTQDANPVFLESLFGACLS